MKEELTLHDKAILAMKSAIKKVMEKHKKSGLPLAVWEDGKVKYISPLPQGVKLEDCQPHTQRCPYPKSYFPLTRTYMCGLMPTENPGDSV